MTFKSAFIFKYMTFCCPEMKISVFGGGHFEFVYYGYPIENWLGRPADLDSAGLKLPESQILYL